MKSEREARNQEGMGSDKREEGQLPVHASGELGTDLILSPPHSLLSSLQLPAHLTLLPPEGNSQLMLPGMQAGPLLAALERLGQAGTGHEAGQGKPVEGVIERKSEAGPLKGAAPSPERRIPEAGRGREVGASGFRRGPLSPEPSQGALEKRGRRK